MKPRPTKHDLQMAFAPDPADALDAPAAPGTPAAPDGVAIHAQPAPATRRQVRRPDADCPGRDARAQDQLEDDAPVDDTHRIRTLLSSQIAQLSGVYCEHSYRPLASYEGMQWDLGVPVHKIVIRVRIDPWQLPSREERARDNIAQVRGWRVLTFGLPEIMDMSAARFVASTLETSYQSKVARLRRVARDAARELEQCNRVRQAQALHEAASEV